MVYRYKDYFQAAENLQRHFSDSKSSEVEITKTFLQSYYTFLPSSEFLLFISGMVEIFNQTTYF